MSYSTGEALILTTLRVNANYSSSNTSRANWRLLSSGKDDHYVILRPGQATYAVQGLGGLGGVTGEAMTTYTTELMCYQRYKQDGQSSIDLQNNIETMIAHMEKYSHISDSGGTVVDATLAGWGEMQQVMNAGAGNRIEWLMIPVQLQWTEKRALTLTD